MRICTVSARKLYIAYSLLRLDMQPEDECQEFNKLLHACAGLLGAVVKAENEREEFLVSPESYEMFPDAVMKGDYTYVEKVIADVLLSYGDNLAQDLLRFLPDYDFACRYAVENGDIRMLELLAAHGFPFENGCVVDAVINHNFEVFRWLVEHGAEKDAFTASRIAEDGDLEWLKWAEGRGFKIRDAYDGAALGDHVHIAEYLRVAGYEITHDMVWYAILKPSPSWKILEWYVAHNYPTNRPNPCVEAARGEGDLPLLKWLHAHGFPLTYAIYEVSTSDEVRQWAFDNGCPTVKPPT